LTKQFFGLDDDDPSSSSLDYTFLLRSMTMILTLLHFDDNDPISSSLDDINPFSSLLDDDNHISSSLNDNDPSFFAP